MASGMYFKVFVAKKECPTVGLIKVLVPIAHSFVTMIYLEYPSWTADRSQINVTSTSPLMRFLRIASRKGGINHTEYWDRTHNPTFKIMAVGKKQNVKTRSNMTYSKSIV